MNRYGCAGKVGSPRYTVTSHLIRSGVHVAGGRIAHTINV
jgi:hypothetical protein